MKSKEDPPTIQFTVTYCKTRTGDYSICKVRSDYKKGELGGRLAQLLREFERST